MKIVNLPLLVALLFLTSITKTLPTQPDPQTQNNLPPVNKISPSRLSNAESPGNADLSTPNTSKQNSLSGPKESPQLELRTPPKPTPTLTLTTPKPTQDRNLYVVRRKKIRPFIYPKEVNLSDKLELEKIFKNRTTRNILKREIKHRADAKFRLRKRKPKKFFPKLKFHVGALNNVFNMTAHVYPEINKKGKYDKIANHLGRVARNYDTYGVTTNEQKFLKDFKKYGLVKPKQGWPSRKFLNSLQSETDFVLYDPIGTLPPLRPKFKPNKKKLLKEMYWNLKKKGKKRKAARKRRARRRRAAKKKRRRRKRKRKRKKKRRRKLKSEDLGTTSGIEKLGANLLTQDDFSDILPVWLGSKFFSNSRFIIYISKN